MEIASVNNSLVKEAVKLHLKKYRDSSGLFLIEGYHLYEEASKFGNIEHIFTIDKSIKGDNVHYVTEIILEKIAKTKTPQKVICVCHKIKKEKITERVLILEGIQDPGNLGTLMRSALAFDFKTIILDNTVDMYNDKVIRSTQGAMFNLNIIEMKTLDFIKNYPLYSVYGTSVNCLSLNVIKQNKYVGIILGNEGQGVSEKLLLKTVGNVWIKTSTVESLNVGVAGSIIMHHVNNN